MPKLPKLPKIKGPKLPGKLAGKLGKMKAPKLPKVKMPKLPQAPGMASALGLSSLQASLGSLNLGTILGMIFVIPIAIGFYVITKIGVYGTGNAVNIANLAGILLGAGALGVNVINKDVGGLGTTTNLMILLVSLALVGYAFMNANTPTEEKKA